eukprot:COSAG02_NODE_7432_length_3015_cov_6.358025_3_plen_77_part_00
MAGQVSPHSHRGKIVHVDGSFFCSACATFRLSLRSKSEGLATAPEHSDGQMPVCVWENGPPREGLAVVFPVSRYFS